MQRTITLIVALCFMIPLWAQKVVTGRVTDEAGKPLPGVSVQVKGAKTVVITDVDGAYSINAGAQAKTLVFTAVNAEPR